MAPFIHLTSARHEEEVQRAGVLEHFEVSSDVRMDPSFCSMIHLVGCSLEKIAGYRRMISGKRHWCLEFLNETVCRLCVSWRGVVLLVIIFIFQKYVF